MNKLYIFLREEAGVRGVVEEGWGSKSQVMLLENK